MTCCPTCGVPYRSGSECYRCRTRLEKVLAIAREAEACRLQVPRALERREPVTAQGHIGRALFLHRSVAILRNGPPAGDRGCPWTSQRIRAVASIQ